jgi:hypothetical protein
VSSQSQRRCRERKYPCKNGGGEFAIVLDGVERSVGAFDESALSFGRGVAVAQDSDIACLSA